jgi:hypothetical protein
MEKERRMKRLAALLFAGMRVRTMVEVIPALKAVR